MQHSAPLVMTSGNFSSEPILWKNEDALERLQGIADAFLLHNRDIHVPCDDSVVRIADRRQSPVRRSRGYAPLPVRLRYSGPSVLAVGAELKSTFCLTQQNHAYLSQHLGDMENLETLTAFEQALAHFRAVFRTQPEIVVCDAHPSYLSSSWARRYSEREGVPLVEVQHHHSHLCSTMAEHGLDGSHPVLGVVFDGTGYGVDGAIWGGEILKATYTSFERILHLGYTPMPGGDASIRSPYRMALVHLWSAGIPWRPGIPCVDAATATELSVLQQQLSSNLLCIPTSSVGRFFDAVASLIGIRQRVEYEAQAAIELEAASEEIYGADFYPVQIAGGQIDPRPVIHAIVDDLRSGVGRSTIASRFQRTVVQVIVSATEEAKRLTGITMVALTGGVMQNMRIATLASQQLSEHGFSVLEHSLVPANDGGIALGQAAIALARQRGA
jgi:hydrogenase maturation protein HypF